MITFTRKTADHILKLHHQVLRPGLPIAEVILAEDQEPKTRHYEACDQKGEVICCAPHSPDLARGSCMATQGNGDSSRLEKSGDWIGNVLILGKLSRMSIFLTGSTSFLDRLTLNGGDGC